ncbi:TolC family protein [bacterium]|nr:MAG: TolC family protein [bacterium]
MKSLLRAVVMIVFAGVPLAAPAQAPAPAPSATPPATAAPTLEPATSPLQLPYPVFGTPVNGVVGPPSREYPTVDLKQSIAISVARSPVLASARADAALAAVQVRAVLGNALPNLSGAASTTRFRGSVQSGVQNGARTNEAFTQNQIVLQVRQLIFDGLRTQAQIAAANAASVAAADSYRSQLQQLALNVASSYYAALTAERQTGAALASLKNAQTQRDLVAAQAAAGTAARSDISNAELQVAQARVVVIKAQATALTSLASFATTLGLSPEEIVQPVDDVPASDPGMMSTLPVPSYQDALKRAFALRPDWSAAQEQVLASQRGVRAARAARWPTLAGSASAGSSSTDLSGGTFQPSWNVGAQLTLPIYDGGIIAAGVRTAQEQEAKAQDAQLTTQLTIESGVKQALIGLASAEAGLIAANQERATADETLKATEARYKAGVTTLPLLLQAQTGFTTALVDQVNAAYGLRQAEQQYLFAIGDNVKI